MKKAKIETFFRRFPSLPQMCIRDRLYADSVYNITREILEGLNARYSSPVKK